MLNLIRKSMVLKIFFIVLVMLFATSLMIYFGMLVYMPQIFHNQVTKQFEEEFEQLYSNVQQDKMENYETTIQEF